MTLVGVVRRVIGAKKSAGLQLMLVMGGIALAAGVRWLIDRGTGGVPFVTFVPIILLAALLLDWSFAVATVLISVVAVVALFPASTRFLPAGPTLILWSAFGFIATFMIVTGYVLRRTIIDLDAQTAKIQTFNAELQHRTKNTLQIVRALASRASTTTEPKEFYTALCGRLDAFAKANQLLGPGNMDARDVSQLVDAALKPFPRGAIHARGGACAISGDPGIQLVMALHELATNATKYGALSASGGEVSIAWSCDDAVVRLIWEERGGPPVLPPTNRGFGSRILSPSNMLREVELDFRTQGLVCRMAVAMAAG